MPTTLTLYLPGPSLPHAVRLAAKKTLTHFYLVKKIRIDSQFFNQARILHCRQSVLFLDPTPLGMFQMFNKMCYTSVCSTREYLPSRSACLPTPPWKHFLKLSSPSASYPKRNSKTHVLQVFSACHLLFCMLPNQWSHTKPLAASQGKFMCPCAHVLNTRCSQHKMFFPPKVSAKCFPQMFSTKCFPQMFSTKCFPQNASTKHFPQNVSTKCFLKMYYKKCSTK